MNLIVTTVLRMIEREMLPNDDLNAMREALAAHFTQRRLTEFEDKLARGESIVERSDRPAPIVPAGYQYLELSPCGNFYPTPHPPAAAIEFDFPNDFGPIAKDTLPLPVSDQPRETRASAAALFRAISS